MSLAASARSPRDWAALEDGPAGLIAERVLTHDVADYVRFRAVCRSWRRCCADPRAHRSLDRRFHPRRWTMLREELAAPNRRCLLNTSTGACVQVDIPELQHHDVLATTPEGLFVLLQKPPLATVRLLNPLTRHLTELPPLTTLLPPDEHHMLSRRAHYGTYLAAWGSGVAEDDSTVVLCFNMLCVLGMAKPGDNHWASLKYVGDGMTSTPLMFVGRFFRLNLSGVMVLKTGPDLLPRLDLAAKLNILLRPTEDSLHLVNNCGELMLVHRHSEPWSKLGWQYDTYRVDLDTGTLLPVKSLGGGAGRAVFMGWNCSLSVSLEVFPAGSISADTIYLSFDVIERRQFKVGAYCLADGSVECPRRYKGGLVPRPHTLVDCLSLSNTVRGSFPLLLIN